MNRVTHCQLDGSQATLDELLERISANLGSMPGNLWQPHNGL